MNSLQKQWLSLKNARPQDKALEMKIWTLICWQCKARAFGLQMLLSVWVCVWICVGPFLVVCSLDLSPPQQCVCMYMWPCMRASFDWASLPPSLFSDTLAPCLFASSLHLSIPSSTPSCHPPLAGLHLPLSSGEITRAQKCCPTALQHSLCPASLHQHTRLGTHTQRPELYVFTVHPDLCVRVLLLRVIHSLVLMKVNEKDPSSSYGLSCPQLLAVCLIFHCNAADLGDEQWAT